MQTQVATSHKHPRVHLKSDGETCCSVALPRYLGRSPTEPDISRISAHLAQPGLVLGSFRQLCKTPWETSCQATLSGRWGSVDSGQQNLHLLYSVVISLHSFRKACVQLRYIFKLDAARALVEANVESRLAPLATWLRGQLSHSAQHVFH